MTAVLCGMALVLWCPGPAHWFGVVLIILGLAAILLRLVEGDEA